MEEVLLSRHLHAVRSPSYTERPCVDTLANSPNRALSQQSASDYHQCVSSHLKSSPYDSSDDSSSSHYLREKVQGRAA